MAFPSDVVLLVLVLVGVVLFEDAIEEQQARLESSLQRFNSLKQHSQGAPQGIDVKPIGKLQATPHLPCEHNTKLVALDYPYLCRTTSPVITTFFGSSDTNPNQMTNTPLLVAFVAIVSNSNDFTDIPTDISIVAATLQFWTAINFYTGTIPPAVFQLTNLEQIFLNENFLSGTISSQFGLMTPLTMLDLHHNKFTGTFPTQIGLLTNLRELQFGYNPLTGTLPSQLGMLENLSDLTINNLWKISSTLPSEFGNIRELLSFTFEDSGIEGSIPSQMGRLTKLQDFSGSRCRLTGTLPTELWNLGQLTKLQLGDNRLQGNLDGIEQLSQLVILEVGANFLGGPIPSQLGLLTSLQQVNLSHNSFTGTFPSQLALLHELYEFDFSGNPFLEGHLPAEIRNNSRIFPFLLCNGSRLLDVDKCGPIATTPLVGLSLVVSLAVLAALLMCVLIMIGSYLWQNRKHQVVRVMSPILIIALLVSLAVMVVCVPVLGVSVYAEETWTRVCACKVAGDFVVAGVVGVVASVTARNYPIWRIFDNPQMRVVHISPASLLLFIIGSVTLDLAIAIPLLNRITISPDTLWCKLETSDATSLILMIVLATVIGLQTLLSVYISFRIRDVSSEFHETQQIARATYNFVTFGVGIILLGALTNSNFSRFLSISLSILMCVGSFVLFLFGPKVATVREDKMTSRGYAKNRKASIRVFVFRSSFSKSASNVTAPE